MVHRLGGFDLQHHQSLGVGLFHVLPQGLGLSVVGGPHSGQTAVSQGLVFHRANGSLGFGRRLHPGDQQSLGSGVQKPQDNGLLIGGHSNDGSHPPQLRRPRHVLAIPRLHRPVFAVKDQIVPPLISQEFNQSRIGITDETPEDGFASLQFGFGCVLLQWSTPVELSQSSGPFGSRRKDSRAASD